MHALKFVLQFPVKANSHSLQSGCISVKLPIKNKSDYV
jgi:hypothetical protein